MAYPADDAQRATASRNGSCTLIQHTIFSLALVTSLLSLTPAAADELKLTRAGKVPTQDVEKERKLLPRQVVAGPLGAKGEQRLLAARAAAYRGRLYLLAQAQGKTWKREAVLELRGQSEGIVLRDLDGDGTAEIVTVTRRTHRSSGELEVFAREQGSWRRVQLEALEHGGTPDLTFVELLAGQPGRVVFGVAGHVFHGERQEGRIKILKREASAGVIRAAADLGADGSVDLVAATGETAYLGRKKLDLGLRRLWRAQLVDLDGDGKRELLGLGPNHLVLRPLGQDGAKQLQRLTWIDEARDEREDDRNGQTLCAADLDGDGSLEVVVIATASHDKSLVVAYGLAEGKLRERARIYAKIHLPLSLTPWKEDKRTRLLLGSPAGLRWIDLVD